MWCVQKKTCLNAGKGDCAGSFCAGNDDEWAAAAAVAASASAVAAAAEVAAVAAAAASAAAAAASAASAAWVARSNKHSSSAVADSSQSLRSSAVIASSASRVSIPPPLLPLPLPRSGGTLPGGVAYDNVHVGGALHGYDGGSVRPRRSVPPPHEAAVSIASDSSRAASGKMNCAACPGSTWLCRTTCSSDKQQRCQQG